VRWVPSLDYWKVMHDQTKMAGVKFPGVIVKVISQVFKSFRFFASF